MTKKQLYFVITLLCLALLYVLFMPTAEVEAPQVSLEMRVDETQAVADEVLSIEGVASVQMEMAQEAEVEPVTLSGEFIGLLDGEDEYQKKFKYLLLNDEEEVLRIDLRPLVGYSDTNITDKLGVHKGDDVVVKGVTNGEKFIVKSIE